MVGKRSPWLESVQSYTGSWQSRSPIIIQADRESVHDTFAKVYGEVRAAGGKKSIFPLRNDGPFDREEPEQIYEFDSSDSGGVSGNGDTFFRYVPFPSW